jgi:hypothetical protein
MTMLRATYEWVTNTWLVYNKYGYAKGFFETEAEAQALCDRLNGESI